jgi:hypothetical protein
VFPYRGQLTRFTFSVDWYHQSVRKEEMQFRLWLLFVLVAGVSAQYGESTTTASSSSYPPTGSSAGNQTVVPGVSSPATTTGASSGEGLGTTILPSGNGDREQGPNSSGNICLPVDLVKKTFDFPQALAKELLGTVRSVLESFTKVGPGNMTAGISGLLNRNRRSAEGTGVVPPKPEYHEVDEGKELIANGKILTPYYRFLHALMDALHRELNAAECAKLENKGAAGSGDVVENKGAEAQPVTTSSPNSAVQQVTSEREGNPPMDMLKDRFGRYFGGWKGYDGRFKRGFEEIGVSGSGSVRGEPAVEGRGSIFVKRDVASQIGVDADVTIGADIYPTSS